MFDINQHLDDIESNHDVVFEPSVRTAVEARAWLTKLGLPFTLDALVRAVLRDGFASGSVFAAFRLALSMPRKRRRLFSELNARTPLSEPISPKIFHCLDLAARIRRGLSVGSTKPAVTRDSVMMAIARLSPEAAIRNLVPRDMAERSISAVRAVAARALSRNVGPSRHYLLRSPKDVEGYLQARDHLRGWYMTKLSLNPSSIDGNLFVHLSLRDNLRPSGAPETPEWEIPGRHDELYLYGVSCVSPMLPQEDRFPTLRILQAEQPDSDKKAKRLLFTTSSSIGSNPAPAIALEYSKELTVAEHRVNGLGFESGLDAAPVGLASSV